jgi:hypothetical protein
MVVINDVPKHSDSLAKRLLPVAEQACIDAMKLSRVDPYCTLFVEFSECLQHDT